MRCQRLVATLVLAFGGCAGSDTDPETPIEVVDVEAIGCDRPQPRLGVGTVVADGMVLTAGHVVDGALRDLRVNGEPAVVVGLDVDSDLALVAVADQFDPTSSWTIDPSANVDPGPVQIRTAHGSVDTYLNRVLTLRVKDVSAKVTTQRRAFELDVVVDPGDSGSPVIDSEGRLIGVVTLRRSSTGVSYASRSPAFGELLDLPLYEELSRDGLARQSRCH